MRLEDSMGVLVTKVTEGDEDAMRAIWDQYFPQVVALAGRRLAGQSRAASDEEDVAISVMESFFRAAQAGRFPDLENRDGIWKLLSAMTRRKVVDLVRKNVARPAVGESALPLDTTNPLATVATDDPTPAILAMLSDQLSHLINILPEKYRPFALKKLECLTVSEIADQCGVHISTVERRLRIVRQFWANESAKE